MQNITNSTELKFAIQLLEIEQKAKGLLLKEQVLLAYENLKPVNIIKNSINEVTQSTNLIDNILGTTVGLASGYIAKKIVIGATGNFIKKIVGSIMQFGITKVVTQNPEAIKSVGQFLFQHIFPKKEHNSQNHD